MRLALGLLTIIPVTPPSQITGRQARSAMLLAPLAVTPIVALAVTIGWLTTFLGLPNALAGAVAVAVLAFGTRAMHLDGLADTVDGLGSGAPPEPALKIMRKGDLGPMGAVALILVIGIQAVAAGHLLAQPWGWLGLAVVWCLSRAALSLGCLVGVPSARTDGLGALVAGSVPTWAATLVWLVGGSGLIGVGLLARWPVWIAPTAVVVTLAAALWVRRRAVKRLGGITGDVLGALVEVAATALLLVVAAA